MKAAQFPTCLFSWGFTLRGSPWKARLFSGALPLQWGSDSQFVSPAKNSAQLPSVSALHYLASAAYESPDALRGWGGGPGILN